METNSPQIREAAVLIPVYRDASGELRLVLIRRGERGIHGGQLAFPGGKQDPEDESLLHTALRETEEEIGLEPHHVEVLAALPRLTTRVSNYRISPFLARIRPAAAWRPAAGEIAEVLDVSLRTLADPHAIVTVEEQQPGWPRPERIAYIQIGAYRLWGATLHILRPLLPRLLAGEWEM